MEIRGLRLSGSFLALVLAMALLGPAPAAAIGSPRAARRAGRAPPLVRALVNLATFATFPLVGGVAIHVLAGDFDPRFDDPLGFAAVVLAAFMATNALNFLMVATATWYGYRFLPQAAAQLRHRAALAVRDRPADRERGLHLRPARHGLGRPGGGRALRVPVHPAHGVQAEERGKELTRRTKELASLQVGLLSTVLQTLSMRDAMTARHSAAVARYAREVAGMLGLPEREQELIHTAALLHDIGKFILPDSVLFAKRKLTDDEWKLIKLHPEQGAKLVERIENYGPVAEIVLHHHERFGGGGYPSGIAGEEIPLGSRIIATADTYDVMTSRDSYRDPVSSGVDLAELRRVAGTQLDPQVVEIFERMILERGVAFSHTDEADFESELAFESRVEDYARPRSPALVD